MDRRKIIDEAISTQQLMEEIDWDKLLWIPGEKKIFLPTGIVKPQLYLNWNWDKTINAIVNEAAEAQRRLQQRQVYEGMCDECMGEDIYRREYLGIRRQEQEYQQARMQRIPLMIRPGQFRNFDWIGK